MTYKEFKKMYKWSVKKYSNICDIFGYILNIDCITTNYIKVGKKWIESEKTTEKADNEYYFNTLESIPFFRGLGGFESVNTKYTKFGLIPYEISSINPDRTQQTVRTFIFV